MYKNWETICCIKDVHFLRALVLLDITTDFGCIVANRFPEYFSKERQVGPIPLSVLRIKAQDTKLYIKNPEDHLFICNAIPEEWPVIKFGDDNAVDRYKDHGFQIIPRKLKRAKNIGALYEWEGEKIILVDRGHIFGMQWIFVPVEFIDINK